MEEDILPPGDPATDPAECQAGRQAVDTKADKTVSQLGGQEHGLKEDSQNKPLRKEALKEAMSCKICFESFTLTHRRLRSFICGHCFCTLCCAELVKHQPVECPACREKPEKNIKDVKDIPIAFNLEDMIQSLNTRELLSEDNKLCDVQLHDSVEEDILPPGNPATDPAECQAGRQAVDTKANQTVSKLCGQEEDILPPGYPATDPAECQAGRQAADTKADQTVSQLGGQEHGQKEDYQKRRLLKKEDILPPEDPATDPAECQAGRQAVDTKADQTVSQLGGQEHGLKEDSQKKTLRKEALKQDILPPWDPATDPAECQAGRQAVDSKADQTVSQLGGQEHGLKEDSQKKSLHKEALKSSSTLESNRQIPILQTNLPPTRDASPSQSPHQALSYSISGIASTTIKQPLHTEQGNESNNESNTHNNQTTDITNEENFNNDATFRDITNQLRLITITGIKNYFKKTCYSIFFTTIFILITISSMILIMGEWESSHKLIILQNRICEINSNGSFSKIELEPWNEGIEKHGTERSLESMYINQRFYSKSREFSSLLEAINENDSEYSKRYLLVAEQGSGKTTAVKQMFKNWCYDMKNEDESFRIFKYAIQSYIEGNVHDNTGWIFIINRVLPSLPRILYEVINKCIYDKGTPFENMASLYNTLTKRETVPVLMFAFEFRDIININTLTDTISQKIIQDSTIFTLTNLDTLLKREVKRIVLVLDGWDEYTKLKYKVGAAPEMEAIVNCEERKNINLIVTTRPWKSDELLMVPRYGFEKLSLESFQLPEDRDSFIHNFFPFGQDAQELIDILNEKDTIVPEELQKQPRMLLYICNAWQYDKNIKDDRIKNKDIFWDAIWKMMRLTYNRKYPHQPMSSDDLYKMRREIGIFNLENGKDKNINFKMFNEKFGNEFDLFYFGLYSTDSYHKSAPWNEDANAEMEQFIKPVNPSMIDAQSDKEMNLKLNLDEERHWFIGLLIRFIAYYIFTAYNTILNYHFANYIENKFNGGKRDFQYLIVSLLLTSILHYPFLTIVRFIPNEDQSVVVRLLITYLEYFLFTICNFCLSSMSLCIIFEERLKLTTIGWYGALLLLLTLYYALFYYLYQTFLYF